MNFAVFFAAEKSQSKSNKFQIGFFSSFSIFLRFYSFYFILSICV